jgi:cytochrome c oxidase subunit 1
MHSSVPIDWQHQDSYFVVAHFHYVLVGGSAMGIFAGIYFWFPKITGRMLNETIGKLHFWLFFIGFNLTFGPMHFLGVDGMPRRIYTYPPNMGWDLWNLVASIGAYMLGVGVLVFIYNVIQTLRSQDRVGNDPWDGMTLEWTIPSPPPHYNYATIPTVHSRDPYWLQKHPELSERQASEQAQVTLGAQQVATMPIPDAEPVRPEDHHVHMPDPSYWPLVGGIGLFVAGLGVLFTLALVPVGLGILIIAIYGWSLEPVNG